VPAYKLMRIERRLEENDRALAQLTTMLRRLLDEGYSMGDLGRELGITRQAVHDLLRRADQGSGR